MKLALVIRSTALLCALGITGCGGGAAAAPDGAVDADGAGDPGDPNMEPDGIDTEISDISPPDREVDFPDADGSEDGVCLPECAGKECGPDGCTGSCPPGCAPGDTCIDGACYPPCAADLGFPVVPGTGTAVCPPYIRPVVFIGPHPDDETISAAGSLRRYLEEGRDVFVELMTQGETADVRNTLADGGTCPWHGGTHSYTLTVEEFAAARVAEFIASMVSLEVTGVRVNDYGSRDLSLEEVSERIGFWTSLPATELLLLGTVGRDDKYYPETEPHPDHVAIYDALVAWGYPETQYFFVYYYNEQVGTPNQTVDVHPWCDRKAMAFMEYQSWQPESGRFATAYHSDPNLFNNSVGGISPTACLEYLWLP